MQIITKEKVTVAKTVTKDQLDTVGKEFPIFNHCDHVIIDLPQAEKATLVLNTPFGTFTICSIPNPHLNGVGCLDIKLHDQNKTSIVLGFSERRSATMDHHDTYSIDVRKKQSE